MKVNYLFVLLAAVVLASSCKNQDVQPVASVTVTTIPATLVARWSIAKDSTSSSFIGPVINHNVYVGTADDYYDFRGDGKCYIKENGAFDTITYRMVTDTSVAFNGTFYPSRVNPLTRHSARIDFMQPQGPGGGTSSKTVFLTK